MLSGSAVYVINTLSDIPLSKVLTHGALGQYHAEHCVDILNASLLATAHRIAVVDGSSLEFICSLLQFVGSSELVTTISKDTENAPWDVLPLP